MSLRILNQIQQAMAAIVDDPRASKLERIEAARVALACSGLLAPDPLDKSLPTKLQIRLQAARAAIAEKLFEQREAKKLRNRKQYLQRRIAELKEKETTNDVQN